MGRWLGDGDYHFDSEEERANARYAEQERQRIKDEAVQAAEQVQIEASNAARRTTNEEFQMISLMIKMMESERFARWYEDRFVPLYIEDRQVTKEEILDDLKRLFR